VANPDLLYLRSREQLLVYEDSRFFSLINAMANFYPTRNDNSIFGDILRAYARELAKLEYFYAYDLVGKEPQFLTPPDIKRQWADSMFISSDFPTTTPVQYDVQYRAMLVALLQAYRQGARLEAIEEVITAYTGLDITVLELYKLIGNGIYDISDVNTIQVSIPVGGSNPLEDIQNLLQLEPITKDLYGAIDLTKPAHVGVNFAIVFGNGEDIDAYVTDISESVTFGIRDQLIITYQIVELAPPGPMLIQAPILNPANPQTTIAAWGRTFPPVLTPTEWENLTTINPLTSMEEIFAIEPPLPGWQSNHNYTVGQQIIDNNYNIQTVSTAGESGSTAPDWTQSFEGITTDHIGGTLAWTMTAPTAKAAYNAPPESSAGNYLLSPMALNWLILIDQTTGLPTGYLANYDPAHPAGLLAPHLNSIWEVGRGDASFIFELT